MRNLHADVLELFSSLDGYDRLQDATERWCSFVADLVARRRREYAARRGVTDRRRKYSREYAARRYRTDPVFRARHLEAISRYKDRKLGANRRRRFLGPLPIVHGSYLGYQGRGCRCAACRAASAAYQKKRRARMKAAQ